MGSCDVCPRHCGADRENGKEGFCGADDRIKIGRAALHMWEEPFISGTRGSGAVFFSGCPLRCVYCQNMGISRGGVGHYVTPEELCGIFDALTAQGAHNLNLVTPTHYSAVLTKILRAYRSKLPVVWNTGGYENVETLRSLEGLVDVYMPDIKYFDSAPALKYSAAPDYFEKASAAVLEMYRQVGGLKTDENGIALSGLVIRHLVLPGHAGQSVKVLEWISENLPKDTAVSLMGQYTPTEAAKNIPPLHRRLSRGEYDKAINAAVRLGLTNCLVQELSSAREDYIPDFE